MSIYILLHSSNKPTTQPAHGQMSEGKKNEKFYAEINLMWICLDVLVLAGVPANQRRTALLSTESNLFKYIIIRGIHCRVAHTSTY